MNPNPPHGDAGPRRQHPLRVVWTGAIVQVVRYINPAYRTFAPFYPRINQIFGWLDSPRQEQWLFQKASSLPDHAVVVEIGSYRGRSTAALGFGCLGTGKRVFALDLFDGRHLPGQPDYFSDFKANMLHCGLESYVNPIPGPSTVIAQTWRRQIDFLFIDGAHDYEGVVADIAGFFPYVIPGGLVAMHDVSRQWPEVLRAWHEVAHPQLNNIEYCGSIAAGTKPV
jgi:predicted O-methyltransferase YrrM